MNITNIITYPIPIKMNKTVNRISFLALILLISCRPSADKPKCICEHLGAHRKVDLFTREAIDPCVRNFERGKTVLFKYYENDSFFSVKPTVYFDCEEGYRFCSYPQTISCSWDFEKVEPDYWVNLSIYVSDSGHELAFESIYMKVLQDTNLFVFWCDWDREENVIYDMEKDTIIIFGYTKYTPKTKRILSLENRSNWIRYVIHSPTHVANTFRNVVTQLDKNKEENREYIEHYLEVRDDLYILSDTGFHIMPNIDRMGYLYIGDDWSFED